MYRKTVEVTISLNDRSAVRARQQQWDQVEDFFRAWFVDAKGALPSAASWSFEDPIAFEEMLETHLRELIGAMWTVPEPRLIARQCTISAIRFAGCSLSSSSIRSNDPWRLVGGIKPCLALGLLHLERLGQTRRRYRLPTRQSRCPLSLRRFLSASTGESKE
jgi:hypothetical protein